MFKVSFVTTPLVIQSFETVLPAKVEVSLNLEFLISFEVQKELDSIGMFSPYYAVINDNAQYNLMQKQTEFFRIFL